MNDLEVQLERLRSPEVEERIDGGWTTVVFACGAVEQHGPHLPLFVDAEHGTALAIAVSRMLGHALVAPTIRVGCSDHHMAFAGTITLRRDTFEAIVTDYVRSLVKHGFKRIVILPTHGGNFAPLDDMRDALREIAHPASLHVYTDLMELLGVWREVVERYAALGDRVGGHADIAETSIIMHLHPALPRDDLAEVGYLGQLDEVAIKKMIAEGFHTVTPNGILGDARGAEGALGERLIQGLAKTITQTIDGKESHE